MVEKLALSVEEAAAAINSTRSQVFDLIKAGAITSFRNGRRRSIRVDVLRDYINRIEVEQAAAREDDKPSLGAAARAALARKHEARREAKLAAEAKPSRRKGGRQ